MMAYLSVGDRETALMLFEWAQHLRDDDDRYWTGIVYPEQVHFPGGEKSTYTAAAVILAADALAQSTPAAALFTDHDFLPSLIDTEGPVDAPVGDRD
jgi:hypothetical protein